MSGFWEHRNTDQSPSSAVERFPYWKNGTPTLAHSQVANKGLFLTKQKTKLNYIIDNLCSAFCSCLSYIVFASSFLLHPQSSQDLLSSQSNSSNPELATRLTFLGHEGGSHFKENLMLILNLTTNIAKSHNNYIHQQKLLNLTTKITKSYNNYLHQQKLLNLTTKITKSNNNHTSKLYSRKVLNPTTKITKSHNKYY